MIEYLQELIKRGELDTVYVSIRKASIIFTMFKGGVFLEHTYSMDTLAGLYNKDYALKSELEQLAIDVCKVAKGGE